ncbi:MAG: chitobiase/beta-hexosaminidase C-terminal domain-containing protein, partial [Planctomycetota bacterium]
MKRKFSITLAAAVLALLAGCSGDEVTNINDPDTTPPTTTALPPGSTTTWPPLVILFTDESATIYYTTDGSDPTTASAVYASPLRFGLTTTLKFFAVDGAGNAEAIKTEVYTIPFLTPSWSVPNDVSQSGAISFSPRIACDSWNTPHVAWTDRMTGDYNTFTASGTNWASQTNVSNIVGPTTTGRSDVAVDSNDVVHIVWRELIGGTNLEIIYANSTNWNTTRVNLSNTTDATSNPSLAVDSNDVVHVTWTQDVGGGNGEVFYANSTNWTSTRANISN